MVIKRIQLEKNVVGMARQRIINLFKNGIPVYLSVSGGKDSIVLSHLVYSLIREGKIDPKQLRVLFVDEEAMHEEVIRVTLDWRKRFLQVGASFDWWCIEVKHFNCFNSLSQDESFICWDHTQRDKWVRPMPKFARTDHPRLRPRVDTYQDFLTRITKDGLQITGVRVAESLQRLLCFSNKPGNRLFKPIYDWKDTDVWLYIRDHNLDFPETYLHLYQTGSSRRDMRLSQFFSVDTAKTLVKLAEYDHGLMDRVTKREPNAYLAALYWDSEMFRAGKQRGRKGNHTKVEDELDFRAETMKLLAHPDYSPRSGNKVKIRNAKDIRNIILRWGGNLQEKHWKTAYNILVGGDPKSRATRALYISLGQDQLK